MFQDVNITYTYRSSIAKFLTIQNFHGKGSVIVIIRQLHNRMIQIKHLFKP